MAPKYKAHIRSVLHLLFECAAPWELIDDRQKQIEMMRVRDSTKRRKRPMILTVESFEAVVARLKEPYKTMVLVAQRLGLCVSEITGLKWEDLEVEARQLLVQRSVVNGRVDEVKTEYSHDVPIHESLLEVMLAWADRCPATEDGWMFPSPLTNRPYYSTEIQKRLLKPIGIKLGLGPIGWHTFRHTYRSWLDETGAMMKVQQELKRHASIQTTMNVYGQARGQQTGKSSPHGTKAYREGFSVT